MGRASLHAIIRTHTRGHRALPERTHFGHEIPQSDVRGRPAPQRHRRHHRHRADVCWLLSPSVAKSWQSWTASAKKLSRMVKVASTTLVADPATAAAPEGAIAERGRARLLRRCGRGTVGTGHHALLHAVANAATLPARGSSCEPCVAFLTQPMFVSARPYPRTIATSPPTRTGAPYPLGCVDMPRHSRIALVWHTVAMHARSVRHYAKKSSSSCAQTA